MSAESDLYDALKDSAGVSALVVGRIYPDIAPEKAKLPLIAWVRTATEYQALIHSGVPDGRHVTLQVYCMADTRKVADQVADAVEAAAGAAGFYPQTRQSVIPGEEDTDVFATVIDLLHYS